jgi:uncharacterized membrane protein
MLVHLPLSLWTVGTACDGLTVLGIAGAWPLAWLSIGIALAVAVPTMVAGLLDIRSVPETVVVLATRHMMLMALAWSAYLTAFLMRSHGLAVRPEPTPAAMVVGALGFALLVAGAACGGQLVYRHGVGVHERS